MRQSGPPLTTYADAPSQKQRDLSSPAHAMRPVGLPLCWSPKPDAPVRCCTPPPGHAGDHFHEYSGATWRQGPT
ncbi:hypothetical protein ACLB9X_17540 [Streptomyces sp. 5K101]|uniref:hypothetical protein n=1 Tax=Streptomyces sp. 5K101 TaxID=3390037 RepID=UPI003974D9AF